jgi:hypothetical protein
MTATIDNFAEIADSGVVYSGVYPLNINSITTTMPAVLDKWHTRRVPI